MGDPDEPGIEEALLVLRAARVHAAGGAEEGSGGGGSDTSGAFAAAVAEAVAAAAGDDDDSEAVAALRAALVAALLEADGVEDASAAAFELLCAPDGHGVPHAEVLRRLPRALEAVVNGVLAATAEASGAEAISVAGAFFDGAVAKAAAPWAGDVLDDSAFAAFADRLAAVVGEVVASGPQVLAKERGPNDSPSWLPALLFTTETPIKNLLASEQAAEGAEQTPVDATPARSGQAPNWPMQSPIISTAVKQVVKARKHIRSSSLGGATDLEPELGRLDSRPRAKKRSGGDWGAVSVDFGDRELAIAAQEALDSEEAAAEADFERLNRENYNQVFSALHDVGLRLYLVTATKLFLLAAFIGCNAALFIFLLRTLGPVGGLGIVIAVNVGAAALTFAFVLGIDDSEALKQGSDAGRSLLTNFVRVAGGGGGGAYAPRQLVDLADLAMKEAPRFLQAAEVYAASSMQQQQSQGRARARSDSSARRADVESSGSLSGKSRRALDLSRSDVRPTSRGEPVQRTSEA